MSNVEQAREHYAKAAEWAAKAEDGLTRGGSAEWAAKHAQMGRDAQAQANMYIRLAEVALGIAKAE
jgi:hypothetical protein